MILIADSGSTKTAWAVVENPNNVIKTDGINPIFMDSTQIENTLRTQLLPNIAETITEGYFYGAGCANEEKIKVVKTFQSMTKRQIQCLALQLILRFLKLRIQIKSLDIH